MDYLKNWLVFLMKINNSTKGKISHFLAPMDSVWNFKQIVHQHMFSLLKTKELCHF